MNLTLKDSQEMVFRQRQFLQNKRYRNGADTVVDYGWGARTGKRP